MKFVHIFLVSLIIGVVLVSGCVSQTQLDSSSGSSAPSTEGSTSESSESGSSTPTESTSPPQCIPKTCSDIGKEFGEWDNGCEGKINCGSCKDPLFDQKYQESIASLTTFKSPDKILTLQDLQNFAAKVIIEESYRLTTEDPHVSFAYTPSSSVFKAKISMDRAQLTAYGGSLEFAQLRVCELSASAPCVGYKEGYPTPAIEFPATYSGWNSNPQVIEIPHPGTVYNVTVRAAGNYLPPDQSPLFGTLSVIEYPQSPLILAFQIGQTKYTARPGDTVAIQVKLAQISKDLILTGSNKLEIGRFFNEKCDEIAFDVPDVVMKNPDIIWGKRYYLFPALNYGDQKEYIFVAKIPENASGEYRGKISVYSEILGNLTYYIKIDVA